MNTVAVEDPRGERHVDTGFIVHNDRNYPLFTALLRDLEWTPMLRRWGCRCRYRGGGFEFANTARGLFAQRSNLVQPRFWRLIRDQLRFNREARAMIGRDDAPSVGEFLRDGGYSRWFVERVIAPEISAVWSADPAAIWEFPISFLAEFLSNHGQLGAPRQAAMADDLGGIAALRRAPDPTVRGADPDGLRGYPGGALGGKVAVEAGDAPADLFDEVVIATHPDQALAMLRTQPLRSGKSSERSRTVQRGGPAHRRVADAAAKARVGELELPSRPRGGDDDGSPGTRVTYWMNNLQRLDAARDYFVTLNSRERVDPERVIEVIEYAHPQITHRSVAAQRRWEEISGAGPMHFCGAYWRWGFHEDGCWSGHRAAEAVGQRIA